MPFEFATAGRILFGAGQASRAGEAAAALGRRVFVVAGSQAARAAPVLTSLEAAGLRLELYRIAGEPSAESVEAARAAARAFAPDLVLGCGGGSVLDTAKAVAALALNEGPLLDFVEVVGAGRRLPRDPLPLIAIPTTAGTGSEATKNAVINFPSSAASPGGAQAAGTKASLRDERMLPRVAIVDPELCLGLPPELTATTGMDALAHLLESFVCNSPNPLVDALCCEGIARVARWLEIAYREGENGLARAELSLASLAGGMALANARLGAAHGLAAPLGGAFAVPHGAACAALLGPVAAANVAALRARAPDSPALARYAEAAGILGCRGGSGHADSVRAAPPARHASPARPEDVALRLAELAAALGIRGLADFGIGEGDLAAIAERAALSSSMRGNPVALERSELEAILAAALV